MSLQKCVRGFFLRPNFSNSTADLCLAVEKKKKSAASEIDSLPAGSRFRIVPNGSIRRNRLIA